MDYEGVKHELTNHRVASRKYRIRPDVFSAIGTTFYTTSDTRRRVRDAFVAKRNRFCFFEWNRPVDVEISAHVNKMTQASQSLT